MARLGGFEPPTRGLEVRCSIHLSYRRASIINQSLWKTSNKVKHGLRVFENYP